jgi:hypothetical protein
MSFENRELRQWIAGTLLTTLGMGGIGYACSPRVTERDAAYKVVRGRLVDTDLDVGLYPSALLPHVEIKLLPKFLQSTTVVASKDSDVNVRTKERARVYGTFDIMFEIDNKDPNFGNVYTELKADEIADIEPYIQKFAVPAIITVYGNVTSSTSPSIPANQDAGSTNTTVTEGSGPIALDDHLRTGNAIKEMLQKILDAQGYSYIIIKRVIPSGVGLSPEANRQLEEIVAEERKLELLDVQEQVADKAEGVVKKQAAVTAAALSTLREKGVPESQLVQAYYLQILQSEGKVGTPFVPGPIPGTGVGSVAVEK